MTIFRSNNGWSHVVKGMFLLVVLNACKKEVVQQEQALTAIESVSAKANQAEKFNTFNGPEVQMGNGKARSWITISHTGVPSEIGIELTAGALSGLPSDPLAFSEEEFVLPLHQKAKEVTPFEHIVINWNPAGHEPGPYQVPHFDFHFYTITNQERLTITPASPLMDQLPDHMYWPQGYVPTPGGVPQMGKHWVNPASPELNRAPFTHTFIYGSYAGKFTFDEPMITLAFLKSGASVSMPFNQPAHFQQSGVYYPTTYNIRQDESGKHYITLGGFVLR
ncbi:MAG: DUF5602 domain-containing protein [Bacteroidota bacterium]|nr:DUF5602 domain-containing protein [Bacteroidota bacterium]